MNARKLYKQYHQNKDKIYEFIFPIKKNASIDIYTIINTTLILNPFSTDFPKNLLAKKNHTTNRLGLFFNSSIKFYAKQYYLYFSYIIAYLLFKIYSKKSKTISTQSIGIDVFFLVDKIIKEDKFDDKYFSGIYKTLEKYDKNYVFIPRLYGVNKNPFKLIKLFQILNKEQQIFLFEFEFIGFFDFLSLFFLILAYPFKTLRLLQKDDIEDNKIFNHALIKDIPSVGFESFTRFIYGKNISRISNISDIYSWSEFQVVERSFNYGIRQHGDIKITACQFFINYQTYFNSYVQDIDYEMKTAPDQVLVNGEYYVLEREKITYKAGVSLRYQEVFTFAGIKEEVDVLLLGSYVVNDTKYMLESIKKVGDITFKSHPLVDTKQFELSKNIAISTKNIYQLFTHTKLAIGSASGTLLEAVACGISVIVIASRDNLTANPLVEYGQGKIWDIAFDKDDVVRLYNELIQYRKNHPREVKEIAAWYKDNFFIEPTQDNIAKAFNLK